MSVHLSIVMMQKDEGELLKAWCYHHLGITDASNICIFDNGSTCKKTLIILKEAESKGIIVRREYCKRTDFEQKGVIIGDMIRHLQIQRKQDFIIPLDCDEFLAAEGENDDMIAFDRETFQERLQKLNHQSGYFKIRRHYFNQPNNSDQYFINNTPEKFFFGSSILKSLDVGFHSPTMENSLEGSITNPSDIIAFHYHNKNFGIRRANAINKMRGRVKNFDLGELRQYRGPGMHLLNDLRGIDNPFAPPKSMKTMAFLEHIQKREIPFPWDLFETNAIKIQHTARKPSKEERQIINQSRRSLTTKLLHHYQSNGKIIPSGQFQPKQISNASIEIKRHYKANKTLLSQLKRHLNNHSRENKYPNQKAIIHVIRNNRSLANALISAISQGHARETLFDCRNFWTNKNVQLLTLTASAVHAQEDSVILRYDAKTKQQLQRRLLLHALLSCKSSLTQAEATRANNQPRIL